MRDQKARRRIAILAAVVVAAAACGGSSPGTPTPTAGPTGNGTVDVAPENLELGREYRHVISPDATVPARLTFEVPAGAVVQLDGTADGTNRSSVTLRTAPPAGLNLGFSLDPGESGSSRPWITSDEGGGRWVLEIAGIGDDGVIFTVNAPLQADGGGTGDAGGHAGTAVAVEPGGSFTGLLGDEDREDWYAVSLGGGDVVSVTLDVPPEEAGSTGVSVVYNGTSLARTEANPGGSSSLTQVFAQNQSGTAQLQFTGTGRYQFSVEAGPQRDGGTAGDAGATIGDAKPVKFGALEGILGGEDTEDFYVLSLPLDSVISAEATIAPDYRASARIEIIYNGQNLISEAVPAGGTQGWTYALINPADAMAYVRVATGAGSYALTITATTQPDGDRAGDAPAERSQAKQVEPTGSFDGILNNRRGIDSRDWYRFEATESGSIVVELAVATDGADIRMLIHHGVLRPGDLRIGAGGSTSHTLEVVAGEVYEFELFSVGQAPYTVTFG
jgi:hypothetical protein